MTYTGLPITLEIKGNLTMIADAKLNDPLSVGYFQMDFEFYMLRSPYRKEVHVLTLVMLSKMNKT